MIIRNLLGRISFSDNGTLDNVDRKVNKTKGGAAGLGAAFSKVTGALAALGVAAKALDAVSASLDFSKAMGKIQTLAPGAIAEIGRLKTGIQDLAVATGKSTADLASGVYEVGSAFGLNADTLKLTEIAAKAATAANSDVKTSIDLLSAVTLAYGDASVAANQHVADLAFQAVNLGKTSLPELSAGMGQVTGSAVQLGVAQEELFAIIGTAAGVTGPTAQMLTQLKATMTSLSSPTADLKKVYKELGITAIETEIKQHGLVPTLQRIIAATDGSVAATAKLFSSDEARALILPLTTKLQGRFVDQLKATKSVSGAAEGAYKAQTEGLGAVANKADKAGARLEVLRQKIGDEMTPAYSEFLLLVGDVTQALFDQSKESGGSHASLQEFLADLRQIAGLIAATLRMMVAPIIGVVEQLQTLFDAVQSARDGNYGDAAVKLGKGLGRGALNLGTFGLSEVGYQAGLGRSIGMDGAPRGLLGAWDDRQAAVAGRERTSARTQAIDASVRQEVQLGAINVYTTPGTTAQQAEQIAQQASTELFDRLMRRAREAIPHPGKIAPAGRASTIPAWVGAE